MIKFRDILNELGEGTAQPFPYNSYFKLEQHYTHNQYSIKFEDDDNDVIEVFFQEPIKEQNFKLYDGMLSTPEKSYFMAFSVNGKIPDIMDERGKSSDLKYYNRLLSTVRNIWLDFASKYKPNALITIYKSPNYKGEKNTQEIRQRLYMKLLSNNIPPGYRYKELGLNIIFVKPEFEDKVILK